jgi:hypothetical protein
MGQAAADGIMRGMIVTAGQINVMSMAITMCLPNTQEEFCKYRCSLKLFESYRSEVYSNN